MDMTSETLSSPTTESEPSAGPSCAGETVPSSGNDTLPSSGGTLESKVDEEEGLNFNEDLLCDDHGECLLNVKKM